MAKIGKAFVTKDSIVIWLQNGWYIVHPSELKRLVAQCFEYSSSTSEDTGSEDQWAFILSGLLREVDPSEDPLHLAHMPAIENNEMRPETDKEKK